MRYRSTFLDSDGKQATAVLDASGPQELHERLIREGRLLLRAKAVTAETRNTGVVRDVRIPPKKQLAFVQSMEGALDAGVPVLQALEAIGEQEEDESIAAMYSAIVDQVRGGESLSEALAAYPRAFSEVFRAMVSAGESSGQLPTVLESVASWLEWRIEITGTIRQAMIYPCIVVAAGYFLILFLLSFVIPSLGEVLSKIGGELPWASQMLIELSNLIANQVVWVLVGTFAFVLSLVAFARTDFGRDAFSTLLSHLPVSGDVVRLLNITQFCRNLGVLLNAGLTMTSALELSSRAVTLRRTRDDIELARKRILGGHKLTDSLEEIELLPPVAMTMVRMGEDAGKLPITFNRLSRLYDRDVKSAVKKALALMEPIVTVVLGIVVGGVAALVITTIYSAMNGISR